MQPRTTLKACIAVVGLAFSLTALPAAQQTGAAQEAGVWVKHDTSFQFMGFTSTYSCDGLADKLRILLIAAGARADAKTTADACSSGYGRPDKFARARLTFYSLAPAANAANDGVAVSGAWRTVVLADRSPRDLRLGDCELVEQFRDKVLPMFTTRNLENAMTCIPNQLSGSLISIKFDVFTGLPAPNKK
jgi:hypothetical protein